MTASLPYRTPREPLRPRSPRSQPLATELPSLPETDSSLSPNTSDDEATDSAGRSQASLDIDVDASPAGIFMQLPLRPRNQPSVATPVRPRTSSGTTNVPPMQRAYSSPGVDSTGRYIVPLHHAPRRPSSPLSAGRRRSPLRASVEDLYPASYSGLSIEPNIPEHAELELSSPTISEDGLGPLGSMSTYSNTFPRARRRPTSPLHQSASAPSLHIRSASPHRSGGMSPSLSASRFANEMYPSYSSASSMPSTPTSVRSRSPSISSLDTIEDIPDAEEAAMMEAEEGKLRADDNETTMDGRRRSLDLRGSGLRSNKERKRWSVCGAERRADFSLEPIEE